MAGEKKATQFVLPAALGIPSAGQLAASIRELRGKPVVIDAGRVDHLGGLCLQALLAARLASAADDVSFAFSTLSDAFRSDLATLGCASELGISQD